MHDIDRIAAEFESEIDEFEIDHFEFTGDSEFYGSTETESPFDEMEEMELAAELLGISDEAELDQFLGKLIKKAWKGVRKVGSFVGRVARSPLGGILKGIAKKALPFVGGALGSVVPGAGTAIGAALGGALSQALEAEFEGLSPEDQEFEMARRFVRLAGTAARQAALAQSKGNPQAVAKSAVIAAMRQHVPALSGMSGTAADPAGSSTRSGIAQSGRWIRRGRKIVLLGV